MDNNKSPSNDGLPKEFYFRFFDLIGENLCNCLNENYKIGQLTNSQRQAVITLIQKPGKDSRQFKSWRPISLINVDVKILSKVLVKEFRTICKQLLVMNNLHL